MTSRDFLRTQTLQLATLRMGNLLNTPIESRFNRLARLARRALGVQSVTISLFDGNREWIKAADGSDLEELPLTQSLAAELSQGGVPVLVDDTLLDDRCSRHPLVTRTPAVRFFGVYPLRDQANDVIGALVAYDTAPHQSTDEMIEILKDAGQLAQRELFLVEDSGAQDQLLTKLSAPRAGKPFSMSSRASGIAVAGCSCWSTRLPIGRIGMKGSAFALRTWIDLRMSTIATAIALATSFYKGQRQRWWTAFGLAIRCADSVATSSCS
jgi:hypothetical protein